VPGPLRIFYHLMSLKRRMIRNPRVLATLICRVGKPDVPA